MFIKTKRTLALLYRSAWVAKGTCGNTHGYSVQNYVGSLPLVLRPDLISTQGSMLIEVEFCAASRIDFDGAHAC